MIFRTDDALTDLGERVRAACHSDIKDCEVLFLFRDEPTKRHGKTRLGTAKKANALTKFLCRTAFDSDPDFVIEIEEESYQKLTVEQQEALLDHELAHCTVRKDAKTGDERPVLRGHDIEEFRDVVERRGLWHPDLKEFVKVTRQLKLFPKDADQKGAA
jgi:hypothetical protein